MDSAKPEPLTATEVDVDGNQTIRELTAEEIANLPKEIAGQNSPQEAPTE
jgi:hypothetical protein